MLKTPDSGTYFIALAIVLLIGCGDQPQPGSTSLGQGDPVLQHIGDIIAGFDPQQSNPTNCSTAL